MCSISRAPRRFECTICTAVAPEEVFTVRTCGTTSTRYDPKQPTMSAQIHAASTASLQVKAPQIERPHPTDKRQVLRPGPRPFGRSHRDCRAIELWPVDHPLTRSATSSYAPIMRRWGGSLGRGGAGRGGTCP